MKLMQASAASAPPAIPGWAVVFCVVTALGLALNHWRFRAGWHMDDPLPGGPAAREFTIMLGYIALPGAIMAASFGRVLVVFKLAMPSTSAVVAYTIMFFFLVGMAAFVWMAKEWLRPTERRTPRWLRGTATRR